MKKIFQRLVILSVVLALSACNFPFSSQDPTPTALSQEEIMSTAVAGAMEAIMATQAAMPTATVPPTAIPTLAPTPTIMAQPTGTVSSAGSTAAGPTSCNAAEFVSETIPDGTVYGINEPFTKTWTFINKGTCTWNPNYKLVYQSGDSMEAPLSVNLTETVAPGMITTVSVPMKTPYLAGEYTSYWALQGEDGVNFLTNNSVNVVVATDTFRVTSVSTSLKDRTGVDCPAGYTFNMTVDITTTEAGTVKYTVQRGPYADLGYASAADATTSPKNLKFDSAGTKTTDVIPFGEITAAGTYWVKVNILSPNNQTFGKYGFEVKCK
jgi:methionine-rich copper-binding protein CopC